MTPVRDAAVADWLPQHLKEFMKNHTQLDSDERLRELLHSSRPDSVLPPRFQESVWRRIERSAAMEDSGSWVLWLDRWAAWMLRPRFALATALVLVLAGAATGVLSEKANASQVARELYVSSVAPLRIQ